MTTTVVTIMIAIEAGFTLYPSLAWNALFSPNCFSLNKAPLLASFLVLEL